MLQDTRWIIPDHLAANTTSGLMIGLLDIHNYDNLTACFYDSDTLNDQIDQVIQLLIGKKNENLAQAVKMISQISQQMPNRLEDCSD